MNADEKPLFWIGSARKDLLAMPKAVRREFGFALHLAQIGTRHPNTKVLKGFGSAGVLDLSRTMRQTPTGRSIRYVFPKRYLSCTASRRSPPRAVKHPNRTWN
jgi:phage-related protein